MELVLNGLCPDNSEIKGAVSSTTIPYDYLVYAVGAEVQTFNIPGVKEHACFMKELHDAEKMQREFMDCKVLDFLKPGVLLMGDSGLETAAFPGQLPDEIDRLLHMVVVGGGPTGIELSGELHDFLEDDLKMRYPELAGRIRITLVEALPSVLPTFSKQLIEYTVSTFKESKIDILTKTMVKEVYYVVIRLLLYANRGRASDQGEECCLANARQIYRRSPVWSRYLGSWQQRQGRHPEIDGETA